ncbi:DUF4173 domain-containing protein [Corallococcus sp. BB11-1]|uniref:DUF4153 domain-containing protein n=1 Tax=Corallococcus sp. BB11-1 TaxID=2996783 RepID=UPI00226FC6A9|nr:DUF4173 domain-containing protein [Corallococcus sp. BB11-1]MCY1033046.1 DUF4173 domain-containing protein [Corallococcus sp. BB11-1]
MSPLPPPVAVAAPGPARSSRPWVRAPRPMLLASLSLGGLAVVLLDRARWGLGFPVLVAALLGALAWLGGREGWQRARPNAWLLAPLCLVAGFVAVRDSAWLLTLNVLTSGVLLMLLAHFWAGGRVERLGLTDYPAVVLGAALQSLRYPPALARDSLDVRGLQGHGPRLLSLGRGLLLTLPVLLLFSMLLFTADGVFSLAMDRALSFDLGLDVLVRWGVGAVFSACVAAGVLGHALRRRDAKERGVEEAAPATPRLGLIEAMTLVLAVDALFFVFAAFQVSYLFISETTAIGRGYTVAEFARHGFFELVVVSLLTLALVMALTRWTRRESPVGQAVFRVGTSLMVGLTLVILASAMRRLSLYEDAYGYTLLRVYTHVFMFGLGAALVWRAVTLWWRTERFAVGALVTALGAVVALNVLNPEDFIARHNLARHARTGSLDVELLSRLSADAVPALMPALGVLSQAEAELLLSQHLDTLSQRDTVPEWNFSRFMARRRLLQAGPWREPVNP